MQNKQFLSLFKNKYFITENNINNIKMYILNEMDKAEIKLFQRDL